MDSHPDSAPCLPSRELAQQQSDWLRGARTRLFRQVNIARRQSILELGAGWGNVSIEIAERTQSNVLAVDLSAMPFRTNKHSKVRFIRADAHRLPLANQSVDLVVTQCAFLWFRDPPLAAREIARVLTSDGAAALIEPDFGGLMEYPESVSVRDVWISALERSGADPYVGRKLPGLLTEAGFQVVTLLLDRVVMPSALRFEFLKELDLSRAERHLVDEAIQSSQFAPYEFTHLPYVLIAAHRT